MKHTGDLIIRNGDTTDYSDLTEVAGSVWLDQGATLTAPALAEVAGSVRLDQGATLTAPALAEVAGSVWLYQGATLTAPALAFIMDEAFQAGNLKLVPCGLWVAVLTPKYLSIGCQRHTWDEWLAMTDKQIAALDDSAAEVAKEYRAKILKAKGE